MARPREEGRRSARAVYSPPVRPLTFLRALSWIGVAISGWSINLRWGEVAAVGGGPPGQWERHVVGAAMLCGVASLTLMVAGRADRPPGLVARLVATSAAAGAVAVALFLRAEAGRSDLTHLLAGPGWTWLAAGSVVTAAAAAATWLLRPDRRGPRRRR